MSTREARNISESPYPIKISYSLLDVFNSCFVVISYLTSVIIETATRSALKKGVLKDLAKYTKRRLCRSLLFDKVAGFRSVTLFKRNSDTDVFL